MAYFLVFLAQLFIWVAIKYLCKTEFAGALTKRSFSHAWGSFKNALPKTTKEWVIAVLFALIVPVLTLTVNYFFCFNVYPKHDGLWIELWLIAFTALCHYYFYDRKKNYIYDRKKNDIPKGSYIALGIAGVTFLIYLGFCCYTWDLFHYKKVRSLLEVEEMDERLADSIVSPIQLEKMCIVSQEVAERTILTQMGDLRNTYEIGTMTKQSFTGKFTATTNDGREILVHYKDQLIYVAPLEHKGFLTWFNKGYSEAYILVDATDPDKSFIVTAVNGKPVKLAYTERACFNKNLRRHLRLNGYGAIRLSAFRMEIDENGHPFAPITVLENAIGIRTPIVKGVAVTDMETGETKFYKPDEAPTFIDCIQPMDLIYERIKTYGGYKHGYWFVTNKEGLLEGCAGGDKVQTPYGFRYYIGIKAISDKNGTIGYMLVDSRTGKAQLFHRDGISEAEAIRVFKAINTDKINANVQVELGTVSLTEPLFYNIEGHKSYFTTYVSTRDLTVKYFAFCSTEDKKIWGIGTSMDEALSAYITANYRVKAEKNRKIQVAEKQAYVTVQGKVLEKVAEGSAYFLKLEGRDETFYGYSTSIPDLRWSGTEVKITYNQTDAKMIAIADYQVIK